MRIPCPYCGERSNDEFTVLGDADAILARPAGNDAATFHDYLYLRRNPAGLCRHARAVDPGARLAQRRPVLGDAAGAHAVQGVARLGTQRVDAVTGEEHLDFVPLCDRSASDEQAESEPGGVLGTGHDVNEQLHLSSSGG